MKRKVVRCAQLSGYDRHRFAFARALQVIYYAHTCSDPLGAGRSIKKAQIFLEVESWQRTESRITKNSRYIWALVRVDSVLLSSGFPRPFNAMIIVSRFSKVKHKGVIVQKAVFIAVFWLVSSSICDAQLFRRSRWPNSSINSRDTMSRK